LVYNCVVDVVVDTLTVHYELVLTFLEDMKISDGATEYMQHYCCCHSDVASNSHDTRFVFVGYGILVVVLSYNDNVAVVGHFSI